MSESYESNSPENCTVEHESPSCECGLRKFTKWLPFLILLVAAALYVRDQYAQRQRAMLAQWQLGAKAGMTAGFIQSQARQPVDRIIVMHQLEGRNVGIVSMCPPVLASNLVQALQTIVPTPHFSDNAKLEGEECVLTLVHSNGVPVKLRAVRLESEPDALYVGLMFAETVDGAENEDGSPQLRFKFSDPAKVEGAGPILGEILDAVNALGGRLPPDDELRERLQNARKPEAAGAMPEEE